MTDELVPRPSHRRLPVHLPVASPELELVLEGPHVEEGRGRYAGLALHRSDIPGLVAVAPDGIDVLIGLRVEAAFRPPDAVARQVGKVDRPEELLRKHMRIFEAVRLAREGVVPGRWPRPVPLVCASPIAQIVDPHVGESERIGRSELRVELRVPEFLRISGSDRLLVGRQKESLALEGIAAASTPQPEVVGPERTAALSPVIPAGSVGVERAAGALELVRAALGDEVQRYARARERRVGTSGRDADGLERIEVDEDAREASDGSGDAVEVVGVLVGM